MLIPIKNFHRFAAKILKQPRYALRIGLKRAKAYTAYYIGNGIAPMPEALTLFMTHRCNLRCKMCGQWGEYGMSKQMDSGSVRKELSIEQLRKIIDDAAGFMPSITLFGGEPLLHPNCAELIRYIKNKKMHCLMITNGSLLKRYAQILTEAGLDELNISLDGGQALHDSIRGMNGLFELIASGLKEVNDIKFRLKKSKPLINLQCTIASYNYHHLEQLIEVAEKLKVNSLTFHNLIFLDKTIMACQQEVDAELQNSSKDWEGFIFEPGINPDELYEKIQKLLNRKYSFSVDMYPNFSQAEMKRYYTQTKYVPKEYPGRCLSPWLTAYIFDDGSLRPCLNHSYAFGNAAQENIKNVWNSPAAIRYRQGLKTRKIFPACVRCTELYRY